MSQNITVMESFSYGMGSLSKSAASLIPAMIVLVVASLVIGGLSALLGPLGIIVSLPGAVAMAFLGAGVQQMALDLHDGKGAQLGSLFQMHPNFVQYLIASVLVGIAVSIGSALLVIPGIVAGAVLMFAMPLTLDKNMAAMEALQTSVSVSMPRLMQLVGFVVAAAVLNFIGMLMLGVGLLATIPVTIMAGTRLYRGAIG